MRAPIGGKPLRECVAAHERVAIVIPDITRPLPTDRLLRWLFAELEHVPPEHVVIVNGTGSHRANTPDELRAMVGAEVLRALPRGEPRRARPGTLALVGKTRDGLPVSMARAYVEADRRIVLGFIEPHFMAGFSGGYKGVFPAVADIGAIMHYHRAAAIGHPRSTWGVLEGNPTQEQIRWNGALLPVDFLVNVTLNRKRQVTRFFCGEVLAAHAAGCAFAKETAMVALRATLPDRRHHERGLSARPEPLPGREGHARGDADRRAGRPHRRGLALQRRVPGSRQLQAAALRAPDAARAARHDHRAGVLGLRPVGGAAPRDHRAQGARRPEERARARRRPARVSRAGRGRGAASPPSSAPAATCRSRSCPRAR